MTAPLVPHCVHRHDRHIMSLDGFGPKQATAGTNTIAARCPQAVQMTHSHVVWR